MRILFVLYDNDSFIHQFPMGVAYVSSALLKEGYDVTIYNQDMHHYPDEHLTQYLNKNKFDVVGISIIAGYYQYKRLLAISKAINKSKNRPTYLLGGHGPSPEPEFFLQKTKADIVVIGEGEETIKELIYALANNKSLEALKGIAYRQGDRVVVNQRRPLIKDVDSIPHMAWHLFPMNYYRLIRVGPHSQKSDFLMPVLSGRGCTFECNFCYRMDTGFRPRSNESIIEEIKILQKDYRINYIDFLDELLMTSVNRTVSLCESFLKAKLNVKWKCNGRLNYAKKEVLQIMKKSGCVFVNYGIESMDDNVLKNMKKGLTTEQVIKGVEATIKEGITPGLNIIFGNIGENKDILMKGVEFLLKYDDGTQLRTIRPVTPYPGSPLYYHAIEKGLLKNCEDFYENKHINADLVAVHFTDMGVDEFHQSLLEANTILLKNYYNTKLESALKETKNFYLKKDVAFRGFRQT